MRVRVDPAPAGMAVSSWVASHAWVFNMMVKGKYILNVMQFAYLLVVLCVTLCLNCI